MRHDHGHLVQSASSSFRREALADAAPGAHQLIVEFQHPRFDSPLALPGGILDQVGDNCQVAVERSLQPADLSRLLFAQFRLDLQEAQLIRSRDIGRIVTSSFRAQDQQAAVTEPVAQHEHRTYRDDQGDNEFKHCYLLTVLPVSRIVKILATNLLEE